MASQTKSPSSASGWTNPSNIYVSDNFRASFQFYFSGSSVNFTVLDFGFTILAAASLSFIGLGATPPMIEWGLMAATSRSMFLDAWWTVLFPGMAIFVTVLCVNLIGDGVRDVLDPKHGARE